MIDLMHEIALHIAKLAARNGMPLNWSEFREATYYATLDYLTERYSGAYADTQKAQVYALLDTVCRPVYWGAKVSEWSLPLAVALAAVAAWWALT